MSSKLLKYIRRDIHEGAASAFTKAEIECNAYCKSPIHCDVWYTQSLNTKIITDDIEGFLGPTAKIVRIKRTTEALPIPPEHYIGKGVLNESLPVYSWLVFWRINGRS